MKKIILQGLAVLLFLSGSNLAFSKTTSFGELLCEKDNRFQCIEIQKGQTWDSL